MKKSKDFLREAEEHFMTADHVFRITYPMLKDKRLIFSIVQNLYNSSLNALHFLLYYENLYKQIDISQISDFELRYKYLIKKLKLLSAGASVC